MANTGHVIDAMMKYNAGSPGLINHALKVYSFARGIGTGENLDEKTQQTLETAAILHDIGIRISEIKYNSSAGPHQEVEGPPIAREILEPMGFDSELIDRVCYLIAHHHQYDNIDGMDYQILVEADFLVNLYEEGETIEAIENVKKNIFRTKTGTEFLNRMFLESQDNRSTFDSRVLEKMGRFGQY